jgi:hypothetical protein
MNIRRAVKFSVTYVRTHVEWRHVAAIDITTHEYAINTRLRLTGFRRGLPALVTAGLAVLEHDIARLEEDRLQGGTQPLRLARGVKPVR